MEKLTCLTNEKLLTNSLNSLLASYTPKSLQHLCKNIATPLQAASSGMESLCVLAKKNGSAKVEALIKLQLVELSELLNLKRPLTGAMIDIIASDILADYYQLNMSDVYLVLKRARAGYYGELYDSLNTAKVEGWFRCYFEERCTAAEEESIRISETYKQDSKRVSKILREKEHNIAAGAFQISISAED